MAKAPTPPMPPTPSVVAMITRLCAILVRKGVLNTHDMALILKTTA